jgi:hypothetical protein
MILLFCFHFRLKFLQSTYIVIFRGKKPGDKPSAASKAKAVARKTKPSPATMPKTPTASAPSRSTSAAPLPKARSSEVVDLEKDQMDQDKDVYMDAGVDLGKVDNAEFKQKPAEASADDVVTKAEIPQKKSLAKIFTGASSSKTEEEKLEQTHQVLEVLMEEIWGRSDAEDTALDKMEKKVANFFEDHKKVRKVSIFLNCVAPELQGGFCIKIQLGAPKSSISDFVT